ncbi:MAG: NAD(P)-dependent oxidoreductase [Melioribacteraceae bacterium]|nr:NAD(P)-dependent oxidoreductase [Melioribacteraceae bacterium]
MKLSLIGTGYMGFPMSEKLLEAGHELAVFNRTIEKARKLESKGAVVCSSIIEAVSLSDTILLMLTDYQAIKALLDQIELNSLSGKSILMMGTISPKESMLLRDQLSGYNVDYSEAPVLGSIPQIIDKSLIVLFGGSKQQLQNHKKIFTAFSGKTEYIGEVGEASKMKLALNHLIVGITTVFATSLGYIRENKLNVDQFMEIVRKSALYAPTYDKKLQNYLDRNFDNPNFPLKHLLKDVNLMIESFSENAINVHQLNGIQKILIDGINAGLGDADYSALYNVIHKK